MNATELLEWLEIECCDLRCISESIADTGDYDVRWEVHEHHQGDETKIIGYGRTPVDAIFDATLDKDDPRRSDYIPPQYRDYHNENLGPFNDDDDISHLMGG